ncbi:TraB/GumN family protein [Novosphingobium sp. SL115]|nr:TraB/GumN family protein [Novosphingobium sp. SL115]MCY1671570.1 TraB/GumN family protein [Novosphingobium sp. SL115]
MTCQKTFSPGLRTLALAAAAFVLPLQPVMAQTAPATAPPPAPALAKQLKPALWKVADEDTTIYLFGTIHALPKGLQWLDGPVGAALDSSGELVTEIPDAPQAEQQQVVMKLGLLQGETLRSMMTEADRIAYEALLAKLKIPPLHSIRWSHGWQASRWDRCLTCWQDTARMTVPKPCCARPRWPRARSRARWKR